MRPTAGAVITTKGDGDGPRATDGLRVPLPRVREEATQMSFRVLAFQLALVVAAVAGPGSITGWKW